MAAKKVRIASQIKPDQPQELIIILGELTRVGLGILMARWHPITGLDPCSFELGLDPIQMNARSATQELYVLILEPRTQELMLMSARGIAGGHAKGNEMYRMASIRNITFAEIGALSAGMDWEAPNLMDQIFDQLTQNPKWRPKVDLDPEVCPKLLGEIIELDQAEGQRCRQARTIHKGRGCVQP